MRRGVAVRAMSQVVTEACAGGEGRWEVRGGDVGTAVAERAMSQFVTEAQWQGRWGG